MREAVRLAKGKPVLPTAWLNYDNYWDKTINASAPRELLAPPHAAIELGAPLANGAAGLLIWGHLARSVTAHYVTSHGKTNTQNKTTRIKAKKYNLIALHTPFPPNR